MAIIVGERIPDIGVVAIEDDVSSKVTTGSILGSGKVVLFSVPGAFTPTCSDYHLPGYVVRSDDIRTKGVDKICCMSVNDSFVMAAWGKAQNVGQDVTMIADGNGDFTRALGLELDGTSFGLGSRSQRFAMIIQDGIVTDLAIEPGGGLTVSSAESVLEKL